MWIGRESGRVWCGDGDRLGCLPCEHVTVHVVATLMCLRELMGELVVTAVSAYKIGSKLSL